MLTFEANGYGRKKERLHDALSQSAVSAWQEAGTPAQPCAAAYLGLSGVEAEAVEAGVAMDVARTVFAARRTAAANDATNALAGALPIIGITKINSK